MHHLLEIWFSWVLSGGYIGIIVLMAMGSTPLPVPAEVVLPPAAFLAAQGKLNMAGVILAGALGAYLGAAFMYWVSRWIGRPLILRFGRFILLTPIKLEHAEHWLNRYQAGGVFFARVLAGRPPSHFHPSGNRSDEFSCFQPGHDFGLGDLVQYPGLSGSPSLSGGTGAFDEPGGPGPLHPRSIGWHLACRYDLRRPLHVNHATHEAQFRLVIG